MPLFDAAYKAEGAEKCMTEMGWHDLNEHDIVYVCATIVRVSGHVRWDLSKVVCIADAVWFM